MKTIIGVDLGKMTGVAIKRKDAKKIQLIELPIPSATPFAMSRDFGDMISDILSRESEKAAVEVAYEIVPLVQFKSKNGFKVNPATFKQLSAYEYELKLACSHLSIPCKGMNNKTVKLIAFGDGGLKARGLKAAAEQKIETYLPVTGDLTEHTAMAYALIYAYEKGE